MKRTGQKLNKDGKKFLLEVSKFLKQHVTSSNRAMIQRINQLVKQNVISGFVDNGLLAADLLAPKIVSRKLRKMLSSAEKKNIITGA